MILKKTLVSVGITAMLGAGGVVAVDGATSPYIESGAEFSIEKDSVLKDAGKIKTRLHKNEPAVTFEKWNGEVSLKVKYDKIKGKGKKEFLGKKIKWGKGDEELHAYQIDDENFEIEVYLKKKPATNVFEFQLEGWEALDFFYQPPLDAKFETQAEKDASGCTPTDCEGDFRPENVAGSYAVYHKTNVNHRTGDINYATGKVFHIYRPKAIDANGVEQWAELFYDNGILTVIVPQNFLDTAIYPVIVDPTFGYTTTGGTSIGVISGFMRGEIGTPASSGEVDKVSIYGKSSDFGTRELAAAIYNDSSNNVTSLVASESSVTSVSFNTLQWWDVSIATNSITGSSSYWSFSTHSVTFTYYYDSGSGTNSAFENNDIFSSRWADPYTTETTSSLKYSIYATYAASLVTVLTSQAIDATSTSATMSGEVTDIGLGSPFDIGFEYGIGAFESNDFTATSTTETATSSIGIYSEIITGLTTFSEYGYRSFATNTDFYTFGANIYQFYTADTSTSTPVVSADNHLWDLSVFDDGTHNLTATSGVDLILPEGVNLDDSEDFEAGFGDWTNDVGSGSNCVTRDSGGTGSNNTGPSAGDGDTWYIFWETSSSICNDANNDSMSYVLSATSGGYVDFSYHMYGASMGTLSLEQYDGSTWETFWSKTGQQEQTDELDAYTVVDGSVDATFASDTQQVRFFYTGATSFTGDAAVDLVDVNLQGSGYEDGYWESSAWPITGVDSVATSTLSFTTTTPSDTSVDFLVAVTDGSAPADSDYATSTGSGAFIPNVSVNDDLTGKSLWLKIKLNASTDAADTPTVSQWIMAINDGEAATGGTDCIFELTGDTFISTDCYVPNSTTTQGNLNIVGGGAVHCVDGATIEAKSIQGVTGTELTGIKGCKLELWQSD